MHSTFVSFGQSLYNFVRKSFDNALPHINKVRNWQSRFDTPLGFNKTIIHAIKSKIQQELDKGKKLKFSLQVDSMYINSTIELDQSGNTYVGLLIMVMN